MARVQYPTNVKYRRRWYPAYTPFEIDDSDLDELVGMGAIVIEGPIAPASTTEEDTIEEPTTTNDTAAEQDAVEQVEQKVEKVATKRVEREVPTKTDLLNMKTAELKKYAAELGVDLSDCTNNGQRVDKILSSFAE